MTRDYLNIVAHYEACLAKYGDTHLGVDWPKQEDVYTRYRVMLEVIRSQDSAVSLLDFGCGAAHLYEYIQLRRGSNITYSGLDISPRFIELCLKKHPNLSFYCLDILENGSVLPEFDYIVMNGVFTEKRDLSYGSMWDYFTAVLANVFGRARHGIAFNVMSKQVDWERDDLFHVAFDDLAAYLTGNLSRHFEFRHDYHLYEYTTYVYH